MIFLEGLTWPIIPVLLNVKTAHQNGSTTLTAPTGSGKTTIVLLAPPEEPWLSYHA
jgi:hypothetical protein